LQASVYADYDSQLSLYAGKVCGELICVDGNDDSEIFNSSSTITWVSSIDETYQLLVHGVNSQVGNFELTVRQVERPVNDDCDNALPLNVGDTIQGSTVFAIQYNDNSTVPACGSATSLETPGVGLWYSLSGVQEDLVIVSIENSSFDTQVSIFIGSSCEDIVCIDGSSDPNGIALLTYETDTYLLLVHGLDGQVGDFELSIEAVAGQE
jgi:hypothetical protein